MPDYVATEQTWAAAPDTRYGRPHAQSDPVADLAADRARRARAEPSRGARRRRCRRRPCHGHSRSQPRPWARADAGHVGECRGRTRDPATPAVEEFLFAPESVLRQAVSGTGNDLNVGTDTLVMLKLEKARQSSRTPDITFMANSWAACPAAAIVPALIKAVWAAAVADATAEKARIGGPPAKDPLPRNGTLLRQKTRSVTPRACHARRDHKLRARFGADHPQECGAVAQHGALVDRPCRSSRGCRSRAGRRGGGRGRRQ